MTDQYAALSFLGPFAVSSPPAPFSSNSRRFPSRAPPPGRNGAAVVRAAPPPPSPVPSPLAGGLILLYDNCNVFAAGRVYINQRGFIARAKAPVLCPF